MPRIPLAALLVLLPVAAAAEPAEIGKAEFMARCAACHGPTGKGDGPIAGMMSQPPRDLTTLAEDNNGAYPFSEVYQAIDGRREIAGHGTSDMPLWGDYFLDRELAEAHRMPHGSPLTVRSAVQGRILAIVYYLQTVQQ